jgi:hypothetical protein
LQRALIALYEMADQRGPKLHDAVRRFVRAFGPLDPRLVSFYVGRSVSSSPNAHMPEYVLRHTRGRRAQSRENPDPTLLFVYAHEARNLKLTLDLYIALADDNRAQVERWLACQHPSDLAFEASYRVRPSNLDDSDARDRWDRLYEAWKSDRISFARWWAPLAWWELAARIRVYSNIFIKMEATPLTTQRGSDGQPTASPSGIFGGGLQHRLVATSLIGGIYAQLTQVIVEQRPLRPCSGCGRLFVPERSNQTFCSKRCGNAARGRRYRSQVRA